MKQTYVFDLTTGHWHQWGTTADAEAQAEFDNPPMWNATEGIFWQELLADNGQPSYANVVADLSAGRLYTIDPELTQDNVDSEGVGLPIGRVVTGILPMRQRVFIPQDNLRVTASTGDPSEIGAQVAMRFSDDRGNTWTRMPDITLEDGAYNQELTWRSLGVIRASKRVFEIADVGGLMRIGDANAMIAGEESDG